MCKSYKIFHAKGLKKEDKYLWKMRQENKPILLLRYNEREGKAELHLTFLAHILSTHIAHNLRRVFPSGQAYSNGL